MADVSTLAQYARELRLDPPRRGSYAWLPGIDDFHGYAGYSAVAKVCRIIEAMTPQEQADPALIGSARAERIGAAAGVPAWEVEQLASEFILYRDRRRRQLERWSKLGWWDQALMVLGWRQAK